MTPYLTQKNAETALDFFDRVATSMRVLNNDVKQGIPAGDHQVHILDGFTRVRNNMTGLMYVSGLRPEVRKVLEASMPPNPTLAQLQEAAIRAEASEGLGPKNVQVSAICDTTPQPAAQGNDQLAVIAAELAAIKSRVGQFAPKKGGGGGATGGAGRQGAGGAGAVPRPPMSQRQWTWCFKCHVWGVHLKNECKLTPDEIAKLTPEPQYQRPTGVPADKQYPNF